VTKFSTEQFSLLKTRGPRNEKKIQKCRSSPQPQRPRKAEIGPWGVVNGPARDKPCLSMYFTFLSWVDVAVASGLLTDFYCIW
jgi:hypothetical protein